MNPFKKPVKDVDGEFALSRTVEEAQARIRFFSSRARQGQWGLVIFGLLSLTAFYLCPWLDKIQGSVGAILGSAPPVRLVSIALAIYAFSALIYILARMMEGDLRYRGWSHLGYLSGFYFFFAYGGALRENFWAILVAGITILALEHYRLWTRCQEAIRQEKKIIGPDRID
jgi:hypothetical protein